jgi:hypothetical protein
VGTYLVSVARALATTMGLLFGLLSQVDHATASQLVTSTNTLIAVARLHSNPGVIRELAKTKRHLACEIAQLGVELQQLDATVARRHDQCVRARALGAYDIGEHALGIADDCIAMVEILEWRRATYAQQIVEIDALTA